MAGFLKHWKCNLSRKTETAWEGGEDTPDQWS